MKSILRAISALGIFTAAVLNGAATPPTSLLVLSKGDHALLIVDPATLKVVGQLPSGPDPHEVIASADGKTAYISNYGGGSLNTITVVDLVAQKVLPVIDLGPLRGPHGLIFVAGKLWFTAEGAKVIGRYDPAAHKVDWVLGTGQDRTHMIYVWPEANKIVTSNVASASMTFIEKGPPRRPGPPPGSGTGGAAPAPGGPPPGMVEPRDNWEETIVSVGEGAEGFDLSPDGKEIWAANAHDGTISIINVASKKVAQTLNANVESANRLKFTPDGKLVFVSRLRGSDVAVFDAASRKEAKRIPVGHGAAGILMQPDGARAFVACTPDDYVAVIDPKTLSVSSHLVAGKQPDGLAWAVRP